MDQLVLFFIVVISLILFFVFLVMLIQWSKNIIFQPSSEVKWTPDEGTYKVVTHRFEDKHIDGESFTIRGWHFDQFPRQPTVLFFPDNEGNMTYYQDVFEICQRRGYNLILFNYPGYHTSIGKLSLKNLYAASESMYLYTKQLIGAENTILWGHGMGAHLASSLCAIYGYKQAILTNVYSSLYDLLITRHRFLFVEYLASYYSWYIGKMDTVDLFKRIKDRYNSDTDHTRGKINVVISKNDNSNSSLRQMTDDNIILHVLPDNGLPSNIFKLSNGVLKPTSDGLIEDIEDIENIKDVENVESTEDNHTLSESNDNFFSSNKLNNHQNRKAIITPTFSTPKSDKKMTQFRVNSKK